MKLLYYTLEGFDTPNPNNHLAQTMIDFFLKNGIEVDLIQSNRGGTNAFPRVLENRKNLRIHNIGRRKINKEKFLFRYLSEMLFPIKAIKEIVKVKKCDSIYIQSNATIVWSLILFKILFNKPITYVIYDIFPNQLKMLGILNEGILYKCFLLLQRLAYNIADNIIVLSDDMKSTLIEENDKLTQKVSVIAPWYDDKLFKIIPKKENGIYDELSLNKEKFLIQYAGSLGQNFDYDFILNLAEELKDDLDFQIVLIGDGVKKKTIEKEIRERKLQNIIMKKSQPLEKICNVYNACDVGVVPLKKGVIKCGFPSKVCQLMICGKPIVSSVERSQYEKCINLGLGFASYRKIKETAEYLRRIKEDKNLYGEISRRCMKYAEKYYGCEYNCKKLIKIVQKNTKGEKD